MTVASLTDEKPSQKSRKMFAITDDLASLPTRSSYFMPHEALHPCSPNNESKLGS